MKKKGFQKGMKKVPGSGRKKGVKNKKTLLKVEDLFIERGLNPAEFILDNISSLEPKDAVKAMLSLLEYCEPKKRQVDGPQGPDDGGEDDVDLSDVPTGELIKMVRE